MKENTSGLKIKGKLVYLRPPTENDFPAMAVLGETSLPFHRGLVMSPLKKEDFEKYWRKVQAPTNACFLICQKSDDQIAGAIELTQIFRGNFKNAYLGYYLFAGFTGKGYMSEAVQLILRYAFKTLRLHRVEANVQPQNKDSIRVLQRAGFVKEGFSRRYLKMNGRWFDHERWAIIVEDWRQR